MIGNLKPIKKIDDIMFNVCSTDNYDEIYITYKNNILCVAFWERELHRWESDNDEIVSFDTIKNKSGVFNVCCIDECDII